uniref:Uncharacterized protein n=1 Tax=Nelumbo nucifera TaxID=4432 RepID=A0A822XW09_NELNU|nr:TPA_asm: hypothetical protein HUJ06_023071 [Nelumbo nucifera]
MSDHVVQTIHDSDARVTKSMHPYQSIWMAHWMQTNCDSAVEISNHISPNGGSKEERCDSRQGPIHVQTYEPNKVTRSVVDEGPRNILEHLSEWRHRQNLEVEFDVLEYGKGVEAVNEAERAVPRNKTPKMNLRNCKNAISGCKSFPIFNFNQTKESSLDSKNDPIVYGRHISRSQFDGNTGQVAAMKGTCQPTENTPQISGHLVNSRKCLEKKSLPASRLFKDDLMESRCNVMPYGFKSGGTPEQSLRCTTKETDWSIPGLSSKKHLENAKFCHDRHENPNYGSSSTSKLLACDNKEMDNHLNDRNCGNHYMVPRNGALQMHDPSTSGFTPPIFIGQQSKKHNFPCSEFLTSYGRSPGKMKLEELNYGCRSLERRPRRSIHDVETLRVCTTVDSVEGLPGAPSRFSQATEHLLITKKTDVNLSKGSQIIRESMVSTKFKQNAFHELFTLPFSFGLHGKGGAKLHSLGNSIFQQRNGIQDVKTDSLVLKNQLSAETDTMDMDIFHARSSLPGLLSFQLLLVEYCSSACISSLLNFILFQCFTGEASHPSKVPTRSFLFYLLRVDLAVIQILSPLASLHQKH